MGDTVSKAPVAIGQARIVRLQERLVGISAPLLEEMQRFDVKLSQDALKLLGPRLRSKSIRGSTLAAAHARTRTQRVRADRLQAAAAGTRAAPSEVAHVTTATHGFLARRRGVRHLLQRRR